MQKSRSQIFFKVIFRQSRQLAQVALGKIFSRLQHLGAQISFGFLENMICGSNNLIKNFDYFLD